MLGTSRKYLCLLRLVRWRLRSYPAGSRCRWLPATLPIEWPHTDAWLNVNIFPKAKSQVRIW